MNNNQFSPNAISHKELNALLDKAKEEVSSSDNSENQETNENQEFNELIRHWTKTSQEILQVLNKKEQVSTKKRHPKSLIALGAMGAHINMALQALKATEFYQ